MGTKDCGRGLIMRKKKQQTAPTAPLVYKFLNLEPKAWTNFMNLPRVVADVRHAALEEAMAFCTIRAFDQCIPKDMQSWNGIRHGFENRGWVNRVSCILCDKVWIDDKLYALHDDEILVAPCNTIRVEEEL
jgi:hypothetical protein